MAGRGEVQVDYSVRDRLDMPPASGWYFKLVSSDIHSTEVLLPWEQFRKLTAFTKKEVTLQQFCVWGESFFFLFFEKKTPKLIYKIFCTWHLLHR